MLVLSWNASSELSLCCQVSAEAGTASLHRGVFLGRVQQQVELMLYFLMAGTIGIESKVHSVIYVLAFSEKISTHDRLPLL